MDKTELAWMHDLLLAVRPPLEEEIIARILRRVKNLKTDTYVIRFDDPQFRHDEGVVGQLDKAIAQVRQDLDRLYSTRIAELQSIEEDQRNSNDYLTDHPEEVENYEVGSNGFAPTGTPSIAEIRMDAVDQFFVPERQALLRKRNRLLVLKHLILTRGSR